MDEAVARDRRVGVVELVDGVDQPRDLALERVDPVFVGSPGIDLDEQLPVQRRDRLERMAEAERARRAGRGVDAGDGADVLVDDPERSVRVRHLPGSVAGLVAWRRSDLTGRSCRRCPSSRSTPKRSRRRLRSAAIGGRQRRRRGDGVRRGVDPLDTVAGDHPARAVTERDAYACGRLRKRCCTAPVAGSTRRSSPAGCRATQSEPSPRASPASPSSRGSFGQRDSGRPRCPRRCPCARAASR